MYKDKVQLLSYFREESDRELVDIQRSIGDYKKQALAMNAFIRKYDKKYRKLLT